MPSYSNEATTLMKKFVEANKVETMAIKSLLTFMQSGEKDDDMLSILSGELDRIHEHKMSIYSELQKFRLDK